MCLKGLISRNNGCKTCFPVWSSSPRFPSLFILFFLVCCPITAHSLHPATLLAPIRAWLASKHTSPPFPTINIKFTAATSPRPRRAQLSGVDDVSRLRMFFWRGGGGGGKHTLSYRNTLELQTWCGSFVHLPSRYFIQWEKGFQKVTKSKEDEKNES